MWNSIFDKIEKVTDLLNNIVLTTMVLVIGLNVFFRYVLNAPLGWSEEIGRAALVWITFFGTFTAFADDKHMKISLLFDRFSDKNKLRIIVFGNMATIALNLFVVVYGFKFAASFTTFRSAYIGMPMSIIYAILPVSAVLWIVAIARNTFMHLTDSGKQKEG